MKSALVERCQSSKMWSSMWNTPLCIIHTSVSPFWWSSFLGCVKVVSQLWSDFVTSKSALTQWHMTRIVKSSSVTGARCDLCHLVSRKSNKNKKDFCKWPIVDWFSWSLDVASKCDQEQLLHCNHLHFKSNIFWQHTLLLILVERIIFQGCFGAFVSFCDIIVFMLCTCLSSKVILID